VSHLIELTDNLHIERAAPICRSRLGDLEPDALIASRLQLMNAIASGASEVEYCSGRL
jgi:hypothetical protein